MAPRARLCAAEKQGPVRVGNAARLRRPQRPSFVLSLDGCCADCGAPSRLQRDAVLARVLARYGHALCPQELCFIQQRPLDELVLLANGHATPDDLFYAAAAVLASPARPAAVAAPDDDDDGGFEITAVIEPAEPAWLSRAKAALQSLLSDVTLAPRTTREGALKALSKVIANALELGEAAAGRAVYVDKLLACTIKGGPAGVKTEPKDDSPAKASRLSAAMASPHGAAAGAAASPHGATADDNAAALRCVELLTRVLTSAGWYFDAADEESDGGQPRTRIMLLAGARELPALLARLRDVASALELLRAEAEKQRADKRDAEPLMAALEALVIESDDDEDAAAAAWEERSAADAAKVIAAPAAPGAGDKPAGDPAAAPGFDDFDDYLWERYAGEDAGGSPPPSESPPPPKLLRRDAAITVSVDDDEVEVVAVVAAPQPPRRRAAVAPPKAKETCRVVIFLPADRGRVRLLLPSNSSLLDVYAAASDFLAKPARNDGIAAAPPILPAHNWATAPAVDTHAFRLIRPDPPPGRSFAPHELALTTLAQAGLFPSGRLALKRTGAVLRAPPRLFAGRVDVLRLTTPLPNGNTLVSPIVHLHDPHGDKGLGMFKKIEVMLPRGYSQHSGSRTMTFNQLMLHHANAGQPIPVLLNNAHWLGKGGVLGARASIPAQDYAEDVLKRASNAVRAHIGGGGVRAANAAADDLLRKRPLMQASGLLYLSNGKLHDHVDHIGHYLVLMSMGCAVDFTVGHRVVRFESGDALVFNGGTAHGVMHGVRAVHPGTCPLSLPNLAKARLSLQLRQH